MQGVLDVQRDHVALIRDCVEILAAAGELLFSTNLRSFRLDAGALARVEYRDISRKLCRSISGTRRFTNAGRFAGTRARAEGRVTAKDTNRQ